MSIIPVVSDKAKSKKPIDDPFGVCICYHGGSKLAKTAIVAKNELSLHFGHIQRGVTMNKQTLRWLIPITPAGEGWGAHRWSIRSIYLLPWGLKVGQITICDRN